MSELFGGDEEGVDVGDGGPRVDAGTNACAEYPDVEVECPIIGAECRGEIGGVGRFCWSRILVWPSDSPLSCNARMRSAIETDVVSSFDSLSRRYEILSRGRTGGRT